jgi:hypothetical protein
VAQYPAWVGQNRKNYRMTQSRLGHRRNRRDSMPKCQSRYLLSVRNLCRSAPIHRPSSNPSESHFPAPSLECRSGLLCPALIVRRNGPARTLPRHRFPTHRRSVRPHRLWRRGESRCYVPSPEDRLRLFHRYLASRASCSLARPCQRPLTAGDGSRSGARRLGHGEWEPRHDDGRL